jgi:hypothetical protein
VIGDNKANNNRETKANKYLITKKNPYPNISKPLPDMASFLIQENRPLKIAILSACK